MQKFFEIARLDKETIQKYAHWEQSSLLNADACVNPSACACKSGTGCALKTQFGLSTQHMHRNECARQTRQKPQDESSQKHSKLRVGHTGHAW